MAITARALAFASRWFDPATVARVFEPLVADWQREWLEAAPSRRGLVHARGLAAFACSVGISSVGLVHAATPQRVVSRMLSRVGLFMLVATAIICLPVLARDGSGESLSLILTFLAPAIAYALPFAMIVGVDAIRCHEDLAPHVERGAALKLAAASMVLMVPLSGGSMARALLPPALMWARWQSLDMQHHPNRFRRLPIAIVVLLPLLFFIDFGVDAKLLSSLPGGTLALLAFSFSAVPEQWWSRRRQKASS